MFSIFFDIEFSIRCQLQAVKLDNIDWDKFLLIFIGKVMELTDIISNEQFLPRLGKTIIFNVVGMGVDIPGKGIGGVVQGIGHCDKDLGD